ncbi:MAG: DUF4956 domain-containing protein [Gallionella sp.]|nr:DUF4956 domain-containing protein [Gallionella sp.]
MQDQNELNAVKDLYSKFGESLSIQDFVINILLTILLSWIIGVLYVKFGRTLSNRRQFAANFVLIAVTTMFVISIVKSSLALSLGLVGALSIVRFRTPIKEPEELAYLFILIGIGLAFGANQRVMALIFMTLTGAFIIFQRLRNKQEQSQYLHLAVSLKKGADTTLDSIIEVISKNCHYLTLKRFDDQEDVMSVLFAVEFDSHTALTLLSNDLREAFPSIELHLIDSRGID